MPSQTGNVRESTSLISPFGDPTKAESSRLIRKKSSISNHEFNQTIKASEISKGIQKTSINTASKAAKSKVQ